MITRRSFIVVAALVATSAACAPVGQTVLDARAHFVDPARIDFARLVPAPPAEGSPQELKEIDELLAIQAARTPAQIASARADVVSDVFRFNDALGLPAATGERELPSLARLFAKVKDDELALMTRAKANYGRRRPFLVDARIEPVVEKPSSPSYPSGHSTLGFAMAVLLADMVPEKRDALLTRAAQYARNRMVGGVHFRSDIEAGERLGRALAAEMLKSRAYRAEAAGAALELRSALGLRAAPAPARAASSLSRRMRVHALTA